MQKFVAAKGYSWTDEVFEHDDLNAAIAWAVGKALETGNVHRVGLNNPDRFSRKTLFSVSPEGIDWRMVGPDHVLTVKALAAELQEQAGGAA